MGSEPKTIRTRNAPTPGNYSQARVVDVGTGRWIYTSGQTGNLPPIISGKEGVISADIGIQTKRTLYNLEAVIKEAGGEMRHVVKTTVFLENLERDKAGFERAYKEFFKERGLGNSLPARSTVGARVPLADEATVVEIEAVAYVPN
jgi:2-iminobutanoate/2-iminopropanoate deaminase